MKKEELIEMLKNDQRMDKIFNWVSNSLIISFCLYCIYSTLFNNWLNVPIQTSQIGSYIYLLIFSFGIVYGLIQISRTKLLTEITTIANEFDEVKNKSIIEKAIKKMDLKILSNNENYYLCLHHTNWWVTRKEIHLLANQNEINYFTTEPSYINPGSHINAKRIKTFNELLRLKINSEIYSQKQIIRQSINE